MRRFETPRTVARPRRGVVRAATALAVALAVVLGSGALASDRGGSAAGLAPAVSGACAGSPIAPYGNGSLEALGAASPAPSVAGVAVTVTYLYQDTERVGSSGAQEECLADSAAGSTASNGSFSVPLAVPASGCEGSECDDYSGPFGPFGFATAGAPPGFTEVDPSSGTSPATIDWVANLTAVALNRTGPVLVSVGAPVAVRAEAADALGRSAEGSVSYAWSVQGAGWQLASPGGANATVEAAPGATNGTVSVTATEDAAGVAENASAAPLLLTPVATAIDGANASAATVDPDVAVTFSVSATGAPGYAYAVTVAPGLGAASATARCDTSALPNGSVLAACRASVGYPTNGTADPSATVSNGFSSASVELPPVVVRPGLAIAITPDRPAGYPNQTVAVSVEVAPGTGSAPYGPACFRPSAGAPATCLATPGSVWNFSAAFAAPGTYLLSASVADGEGENASATVAFLVASPLSVQTAGSQDLTTYVGYRTEPRVLVSGGALPGEIWWNVSTEARPLCVANVPADGTYDCPAVWNATGVYDLVATVRDASGTDAAATFAVNVLPAASAPHGDGGLPGPTTWIPAGVVAAVTVPILLVISLRTGAFARRKPRPGDGTAVDEAELERIATGREYLLARADPARPRRAEELTHGWSGPTVRPEEWSEWIAALVADGSLVPRTDPAGRVAYVRGTPPAAEPPVIRFDPAVWEAHRAAAPDAGTEPEDGAPPSDGPPQDGG